MIATGSVPAVPDLPGLNTVGFLTSTTAMELTVLPETVVVVGGGYVGMEQDRRDLRHQGGPDRGRPRGPVGPVSDDERGPVHLRRAVPQRQADELLRVTGPREPKQRGSWAWALITLPVLCCAGPALLAALGAWSVWALLGGATGSVALVLAGLTVVCVTVAVLARRRTRR